MRFFLEFVSCCGSPTLRPPEPTPPAEDEERSLVRPAASRTLRRKKRVRVGRSAAAPEWRPSLGSISEDHAVPQRERGDTRKGAARSGRDVKRRSSGGAPAAADAAKVRHRTYSADYGVAAMPMIMPTYSPTPFMF